MIWAQGCRSLLQLALCKRYQARLSPALRRRMGTCRRTHAKDVSMNSGHAERGLTTVDAYAQSKGACGGIDFLCVVINVLTNLKRFHRPVSSSLSI